MEKDDKIIKLRFLIVKDPRFLNEIGKLTRRKTDEQDICNK